MKSVTCSWCLSAAAALCMGGAFGVGCAGDESPPRTAANVPQQTPVASQPAQQPAPQERAIVASKEVRRKCQIPDTPEQSPQFDLDEAELRPRGENILSRIATCMQDGALKGESITLIGHADPRGSDAYNRALGMDRARAARDYLGSQGVAVSSLNVKSRGELDATGTDRATWQLDRRVELAQTSEM